MIDTMSGSTINAVPFRSTIFYTAAGTRAALGTVFTVGANGIQSTTNALGLQSLLASTMTASTVSFSTMTASTILTQASTITLAQNVNVPNRFVEIGCDAVDTMYFDFHSKDSALPDYSTRIQSVGGATTGTGNLNMYASTIGLMPTVGVGIGVTVPSASLHIKNATSAMRVTGNLTNTSTRPAVSITPGAFEIRGSGLYDGSDDGFLRLSAGGGGSTNVQSYIDLSGYSTVADMSANIIFGTLGLERMRIISNGYVGIGLTVPSAAMLHIGSSGIVRLGPSGNIGTTSAALGAEVSRYQIGFSAFRDIGVDQIGSKIVSINYNGWQNANPLTNYTELAFFTTSQTSGGSNYVDTTSERVRITGSGNVGIGTAIPQATLHVVGNLRSQSVVYSLYGQATAATATNTTVSFLDINTTGTFLISVQGIGGGYVNASGVALVAFYYDGGSGRYANITSISVINFVWSSITASTGAITFQQTTGFNGVVCAFYALRIA